MTVDVEQLAERIAQRILEGQIAAQQSRQRDEVAVALAPDDRPLYSPKTLAERLGISERAVRDLIAAGPGGEPPRIRSLKVESARRIEPAEVDRYLAEQKRLGDG